MGPGGEEEEHDEDHEALEAVLHLARGAGPSFSADHNLNVLRNSCDRMYLCTRSVEMGT